MATMRKIVMLLLVAVFLGTALTGCILPGRGGPRPGHGPGLPHP